VGTRTSTLDRGQPAAPAWEGVKREATAMKFSSPGRSYRGRGRAHSRRTAAGRASSTRAHPSGATDGEDGEARRVSLKTVAHGLEQARWMCDQRDQLSPAGPIERGEEERPGEQQCQNAQHDGDGVSRAALGAVASAETDSAAAPGEVWEASATDATAGWAIAGSAPTEPRLSTPRACMARMPAMRLITVRMPTRPRSTGCEDDTSDRSAARRLLTLNHLSAPPSVPAEPASPISRQGGRPGSVGERSPSSLTPAQSGGTRADRSESGIP